MYKKGESGNLDLKLHCFPCHILGSEMILLLELFCRFLDFTNYIISEPG